MMFRSTMLLGVFAAFALSTVPACDDKKDDKKADDKKDGKAKADEKKAEEKKAEEKKAEEKKEEPAAGGGAADGGGGGDKIGIPECDDYIEKYTKCIKDKVPEAARAQMQQAMDASVKAWKEAASGPGKDSLATGCKAAFDAAKQATSAMGCEW